MTAAKRLLIANRGEIACRILRTARKLGYFIVAIYTSEDSASPHVSEADAAALVSSYISIKEITAVIESFKIQYVIPGYGFLSENAEFASHVEQHGARFVGPSDEHIRAFGLKDQARILAAKAGVPIVPGSDLVESIEEAEAEADRIGYPIMMKATAGGGGMGLQICHDRLQLQSAYDAVVSRGQTLFSNAGVFLERYFPVSRHIEAQVFGDGRGDCVVFGERECSIQRRHQKVIEESPSPFVDGKPGLRDRLLKTAHSLACNVKYRSAGTVEYLVDDATGDFFFLEMNTRLQVEHGVTELRFDIDLVEMMLRQAEAPLDLSLYRDIRPHGAAIEARLYSENPIKNFTPSPGLLQQVRFPDGDNIRVDTWVMSGTKVSPLYDPLLAKVMSYGAERSSAADVLTKALEKIQLQGVASNLLYCKAILDSDDFRMGNTTTSFLNSFSFTHPAIEILSPGSYTTVQDYPARKGVGFGIPPSGPADSLHARLANLIVGNEEGTEMLELVFNGPTIKFHDAAVVAIAGADIEISLDQKTQPMWTRLQVPSGSVLKLGGVTSGACSYLAIKGGFPGISPRLGSKSTSPVIGMGGQNGRPLAIGDFIDIVASTKLSRFVPFQLPRYLVPQYDMSVLYCLRGPHGSADIITENDWRTITSSEWTVSHQSSRVGIRLIGPKLEWSRTSGGQGGSHPSNTVDYPYPVGGIIWTGDEAAILPADCPSLGGFVTSHVVPKGEIFKLGQLKPGSKFYFVEVDYQQAVELDKCQEALLQHVAKVSRSESVQGRPVTDLSLTESTSSASTTGILARFQDATIRQGGDQFLLVDYPQTLDLGVRCKVQALVEVVSAAQVPGIVLVQPMGCAWLVQYDSLVIPQAELVQRLLLFLQLNDSGKRLLSSRVIRLPMVFDDRANREAIEKYIKLQRPYASYLPDPIEFIAKANGLESRDDVLRIVLETRFLVVGVGFFSGTPLAVPLDPRSQLTVPKFNPSRTSSPAGGLGFGGSYLCCDPVDAPGGYVNFARTIPGWDQFCRNRASFGDQPWIFRNFDQLSFYQVTEDEFDDMYAKFQAGQFVFDIQEATFDIEQYQQFCLDMKDEVAAFKSKQHEASEREANREKELVRQWEEEQLARRASAAQQVESPMHASVYKVLVEKDQILVEGETLLVLEAMKMEVKVCTPPGYEGLKVKAATVLPGDIVTPGDCLVLAY
ncbi:putative urea amidolyase [Fusarium solani]|uniref:Urea amidolyase n=1 Tax=Fusarium solani TaxID=169388 RepID=A0A9P9HM18_FUSSL|nr:putative urea amidolyase [Fusarium solani]KAH7259846.1 putative urea amidolyase [Fusarium solani]